ncbi:MAG: hypothetical protein OXB95_06695, partial [Rhodobacteraceae bacterium]|nr:hypothetical protein [Paracoccaceae bacterium]
RCNDFRRLKAVTGVRLMNEGKRSSVGAAAPESGIPLGEWRDGAGRFAAEPNGACRQERLRLQA